MVYVFDMSFQQAAMKFTTNYLARFTTMVLLLCFCFFIVANQQLGFAQDQEQSSRRQINVVEKIETAGGRVMQISSGSG